MSRVLAIHGVTTTIDRSGFSGRNLLSGAQLHHFLAASPRFGPLSQALRGGGHALTIDDSMVAARDAAVMARKHGHDVTLFVNPGQIESGAPYAFVALN